VLHEGSGHKSDQRHIQTADVYRAVACAAVYAEYNGALAGESERTGFVEGVTGNMQVTVSMRLKPFETVKAVVFACDGDCQFAGAVFDAAAMWGDD